MSKTMMPNPISAVAAVAIVAACTACGGAPMSPSESSTSATIDSVVTTFRGAVVETAPVTIPSPEALDVETRFTLHASPASRATLYVCVLETPSSIGAGNCVSVSSTAAEFQQRNNIVPVGISTFKTDGVARTTMYVYVALAEGAFPWIPAASPPRMGDTFAGGRVLATTQLPRTVTFR